MEITTPRTLANKLEEKYGLGGMSKNQIAKEFNIRAERIPSTIEHILPPGGIRKRYTCTGVAEWWCAGRVSGINSSYYRRGA